MPGQGFMPTKFSPKDSTNAKPKPEACGANSEGGQKRSGIPQDKGFPVVVLGVELFPIRQEGYH
jgi:hypothetical protein